MFGLIKRELLNVENWSGDTENILGTLMATLTPDIRRAINKLYKPIIDTEAKYLANLDEDEDADVIKQIISKISRSSFETVERLLLAENDRMTQSYFGEVMNVHLQPISAANLKNLLVLPLYSIKTDFMRLCDETLDVIKIVLDGAGNSMKRAYVAYHDDRFDIKDVPRDFVPVIFPYIQLIIADDWEEMKKKQEESEFPQHIESVLYDLTSKMANDVNNQVKEASSSLLAAIKSCDALSDETKKGLEAQLNDAIGQSELNIDKAKEEAADDLKKSLPDSFDDKTAHYWSLLDIAQSSGDEYAQILNDVGGNIMGDITNLYDMIGVSK